MQVRLSRLYLRIHRAPNSLDSGTILLWRPEQLPDASLWIDSLTFQGDRQNLTRVGYFQDAPAYLDSTLRVCNGRDLPFEWRVCALCAMFPHQRMRHVHLSAQRQKAVRSTLQAASSCT